MPTRLLEFNQKKECWKQQILRNKLLLLVLLWSYTSTSIFAQGESYAVMEVAEITFKSQEQYKNPYIDVDVWIELKKSDEKDETYRIPIFWDGGNIFRARLVATSPGNWTWNIINETVKKSDQGFIGKSGSFTATTANVSTNPNNRGFIKVASNNRTLEYADGTPFFYTADTSWSALTEVFGFNQANDITGISFKNYILARKRQGFNGLNVIASFPDDTYIGDFNKNKQFPNQNRGLWSDKTWGKKIGPQGVTPFEMKAPGALTTDWSEEVDYRKINPKYWQSVDERMQFLSEQGFVTLFEAVRRHERWPFRTDATEKDSFYNYMRYLWARYGCYNMIFSWVHLDSDPKVYKPWRSLVEHAHKKLSTQLGNQMPYGQPRTSMSFNTSLTNWGNPNESNTQTYPGLPAALDVQNVSNSGRDERMHRWLNDLYKNVEQPAFNLEPFYPGWVISGDFNAITAGLDDTTMAQMQMYGSVLSGGLAGHAWGDAWYAGAADTWGTVTPRMVAENDPQVNAINAYESQSMGHLKSFILDADHEYDRLIPAADSHLSDSQNYVHSLAISDDEEFALGFFAGDSRPNAKSLPSLTNLEASKTYYFEWYNVTTGKWISVGNRTTSTAGILQPPTLSNNERTKNWAYRIRSLDYINDDETVTNFALRINCGGDSGNFNGEAFVADTYADTGKTLNRPQTGLAAPFKSFRYSKSQVMGYDIPLENGEYTVKLHFAELWFGATNGGSGGVGSRVFDVRIEDDLVEDNLDVFALVGADTTLSRTHTITITDGELDINFSSKSSDGGARHPIINAIEIIGIEENTPPSEDILEERDDLIGHWPLNETNGTIANDIGSQGHVGKLENGITFEKDKSNGQIEGALLFDGSDDWISLPDIDNDLRSNFSISSWIKPSNAEGGYQGVFGSTTLGGFMMFIKRGQLAFKVTTNENGLKLRSGGTIQNNVWQMVTCTYDGSYMHMYINGEKVYSEALSGTLKDRSVARIGWSGWGKEYFEGGIDDVKLFNNALTEQEIFSLFEEGNGNAMLIDIAPNTNLLPENGLDMEAIKEYPNPTRDIITITGLLPGMQLTLFDFSGIQVASRTVTVNGNFQMNLSEYPKGMYVLKISNEAEVVSKIIVLE